MPNWCENSLTVSSNDKDTLQKFYEDNDNCPTCKQVLSNKQELIADNNKQVMKWNQALCPIYNPLIKKVRILSV